MNKRIFDIIGWVACALIVVAAYLSYWQHSPYGRWLAVAGLVLILIYIASAAATGTRQTRYGTLSVFSVIIVLGILIAVNYIGAKQHKRWDLTANKQFSLSDQSRNLVATLDAPLNILVLDRDSEVQPTLDRLKEYSNISKQVQVEHIDPERQPAAVQQYQIKQLNTIILTYKTRTERITSSTEPEITGAIVKLVTGQQRKVYFTTGHGEKDPASQEREGMSAVDQALKQENYLVEPLALIQKNAVPDDASVVVVAGPDRDFFPPEIEALKTYLAKGGKLLLMLDPQLNNPVEPLPNLAALAHEWGMNLGSNVIVDVGAMSQVFGNTAPSSVDYPPHPATERFRRAITAYSLARSVDPVEGGVSGHTAQPLALSSPDSWAETDVKALTTRGGKVEPDKDKEKIGNIPLAAAASAPATAAPAAAPAADGKEPPKPETRIAVFGDSDFASNGMGGIPGNRDMFMNVVAWLSQQENLVSIRAREPDDRRIDPSVLPNLAWVVYGVWLGTPALVLLAGLARWMRKG